MFRIAIVGRPNTGKSTMFNKLIGRRKSIVEPTPGVTRDVNEELVMLEGIPVLVYDTGGLMAHSTDVLNDQVQKRAMEAAKNADLILFVVDVTVLHPDDEHYARGLRKLGKPVILVINKVDHDSRQNSVFEFDRLGFTEKIAVSAEHNIALNELMDMVNARVKASGKNDDLRPRSEEMRIAIVGKPNAGKSTMLNTLLGEDRTLVSEIAGTTRDPIDALITYKDTVVRLIDTAGIRKKKRVSIDVEYYSVNRAIKTIEASDVVILLVDITQGFTDQDKKIASLIVERNKGIVVAVNKWDARPKGVTWENYSANLRHELSVASYAIITNMSGLKKKDTEKTLGLAVRIAKVRHTEIPTHALTELLHNATKNYTVSAGKTTFKVFFATQKSVNPPTFLLFCNHPDKIKESYRRYLERELRQMFDFQGTPVVMFYKKRERESAGE
ncbi:MAG: ribosome biogenesis GTPase Der [Spirochaetes bacterium]|nr:ribosome biogenesis GTPase Der [Spirochaetota bacterium]